MRVLVTGCAGFVGSHLAEQLLSDGNEVVGVDCFNDNYGRSQKLKNLRHILSWERAEFVPIDLARGALRDLVEDCDVIFHLAAEPGVRSSWGSRYSQYVQNNIIATQHLLESLREKGSTRLVYASSSSVYGDSETMPTPESAVLKPRSPYGQTKVAMEHICDLYNANFGVDVIGLRYFTVFGPRQRPDMAFHRFCRAAIEGTEMTVFGDGNQTRDFTFVDDIVAATRSAAQCDPSGPRIYNIGGGSPARLRDAIDMIGEIVGRPMNVVYSSTERGDVRDTAADTTLARTDLKFVPKVQLREGLAAEVRWIEELIQDE
jgi:nucleoside-diphosphate-sugar epimerase